MPVWLVKAIWIEDEAEVSEQWEVDAARADEAIKEIMTRLRFLPHHLEARQCSPAAEDRAHAAGLQPGEVRRVPPQ